MAEGSNGRRRFSDKWGKHELDVLAVLSSAFPQWLTSRQIAQRVKAYADSYGELADQAAKAAFAKQFQRDRAKLAAMGIAIESRQPEYSSKSEGAGFRLVPPAAGATSRASACGSPRRICRSWPRPTIWPVPCRYPPHPRSSRCSSMPRAPRRACPRRRSPDLVWTRSPRGLGTQAIPDALVKVIDSRRFAATVDVDGELLNVAYTDSDDLAMFVLQHPGAAIVSPQEAVDAFHRRLNAASQFQLADESASPASATVVSPSISRQSEDDEEDPEEMAAHQKKERLLPDRSEVDRRLRLMLFLSAHLGEEFSLEELAERFIGKPKNNDERRKHVATIHKDINTLTTVSDDGEMAGSQFFDIDWSLLDAEGIVSATNSLGLERLAGISPQYLSMLTASVSYLAHSPLLPEEQRAKAASLNKRLRQHVEPGEIPWLSLTGYEVEPHSFSVVKRAISTDSLLDMEYTDGAGRTRRKLVAPAKIFVDEGAYYTAVWTDVADAAPKDKLKYVKKDMTINKATGEPRIWQTLRLARIEHAELVKPTQKVDIPDVPSANCASGTSTTARRRCSSPTSRICRSSRPCPAPRWKAAGRGRRCI